MTLDDLYPLFDADRGTLSTSSHRSFLKEVQAQGLTYAPYAQRVGPGFATASSELKRALDAAVLTCPHSPYQSKFQKSEVCKIN